MKKTYFLITISYLLSIFAIAQVPSGYYDNAQGLTGENLKTELYNIIKDHSVQSYGSLWDHYYTTDDKPNGKVWDMYSDVPDGTPPYEYTFGTNQCGNYNSENDCYNREHSFPKSWFDDSSPMVTDIIHIVPTDGYVNGKRSNWPFGETNSPSWTSMNGSKVGSCSVSGYNGTIFEPIDAYKGDFARIYFYMATRYENLIANWENNSSSSDAALNGSSYPCYEEWYLNMLLDWHRNDPVSQKEIDRNNDIYDIQDNRNPFVDRPIYVSKIWDPTNAVSDISIHEIMNIYTGNNGNTLYLNKLITGSEEFQLILYNISGQELGAEKMSNSSFEMDIANTQKGCYILQITNTNNQELYHFKFIK